MIKISIAEDVHERLAILKARKRTKTLGDAIDLAVNRLLAEMDAAPKEATGEGDAGNRASGR